MDRNTTGELRALLAAANPVPAEAVSGLEVSPELWQRIERGIADSRPRIAERSWIRRHRRLTLAIAFAVFVIGGGAAASVFGPLHDAILGKSEGGLATPGSRFACDDVIGMPAAQAGTYFRARGYAVSWRFMHWGGRIVPGDQGEPRGVTGGYSEIATSPPAGTVVYDVLPGEKASTVIVFVHDPNDPNKPRVEKPSC